MELRGSHLYDFVLSRACIAFKCIATAVSFVSSFARPSRSCIHSFIFLRGMRVAYLARGHYLFVFALAALCSLNNCVFLFFWHDKQKEPELKRNECDATSRYITHSNSVTMSDNERTEQQIRRYGVTSDFHSIIRRSACSVYEVK